MLAMPNPKNPDLLPDNPVDDPIVSYSQLPILSERIAERFAIMGWFGRKAQLDRSNDPRFQLGINPREIIVLNRRMVEEPGGHPLPSFRPSAPHLLMGQCLPPFECGLTSLRLLNPVGVLM